MKKKTVFRILSALLTAAALLLPAAAEAAPADAVTVTLGGEVICAGQSRLIDASTYVPLRTFCAAMGVTDVAWDPAAAAATVTAEGLSLYAAQGSRVLEVNGRAFYAPTGIRIEAGSMLVPIRPLARAFGCDVVWDGGTATAIVIPTDEGWAKTANAVYGDTDLYWLSRIISAESRGEPLEGQLAVGNVVLNRVASPQFPNSVYGVIFDTAYAIQFTPVANGTIYDEPAPISVLAAKLALEGYTVSDEILYFLNPKLSTSFWIVQNRPFRLTIGTHDFYA